MEKRRGRKDLRQGRPARRSEEQHIQSAASDQSV
jgi:hypothetical protein